MPLHDIFLGTATVSVILAAPAAALSGQNRLAVSATVVSPCAISLADAPEPAEVQPMSVACASPGQPFTREDEPALLAESQPSDGGVTPGPGKEDMAEFVEIIF